MGAIVIDSIFEGIATKQDGSVKMMFVSQELSPEAAGRLFGIRGNYVIIAIKSEGYSEEELKAVEDFDGDFKVRGKTPSAQLRSVLFLMYGQNPEGFETFDRFYKHQMDKIVTHFKGKLDD